jgi:hypothetical protein
MGFKNDFSGVEVGVGSPSFDINGVVSAAGDALAGSVASVAIGDRTVYPKTHVKNISDAKETHQEGNVA